MIQLALLLLVAHSLFLAAILFTARGRASGFLTIVVFVRANLQVGGYVRGYGDPSLNFLLSWLLLLQTLNPDIKEK